MFRVIQKVLVIYGLILREGINEWHRIVQFWLKKKKRHWHKYWLWQFFFVIFEQGKIDNEIWTIISIHFNVNTAVHTVKFQTNDKEDVLNDYFIYYRYK